MGTNLNFNNNFGNRPPFNGGATPPPPENYPLARQTSIYSLTFDELQSKIGGSITKDFGSMNMDELLMNIWSAEETQTMAISASRSNSNHNSGAHATQGGYLQKQGSLTLPRTLSHKTVDEVWKDMFKEDVTLGNAGVSLPQRQQTLGEMTLEEFLARAGIVREDNSNNAQMIGKNTNNNGGLYEESLRSNTKSTGLGFEFQVAGQGMGLVDNPILENTNQIYTQSPNRQPTVNEARLLQQQPRQLFPKQTNLGYAASPMLLPSNVQLGSPSVRGGMAGMTDLGVNNNLGIVGLGAGAVTVATGSPADQISSDGTGNGNLSSVSPVPYVINGGIRGRRSNGAVEKVVERRQRRMIKNRESAARSRARKQAYTMELEGEIAKLKEDNQQLRRKQAELIIMQKTQVQETDNSQPRSKKRRLTRWQTGPW